MRKTKWEEGMGATSLQPINDPGFVEIVRGHLQLDSIADGQTDKSLSHLARDVREDLVLVRQFNTEHRAWQHSQNRSFEFYVLSHAVNSTLAVH